ncbi:MAG: hypothetical protein H6581_05720 [Bacteroidia bacterium]|nr:hypothetical protein [Bacteroidia bacterium]
MRRLFTHLKMIWDGHRLPVLLILAAGIVLVIFTFTRNRLTTNPRSRIITVERLVDAGTWVHSNGTDSSRFEPSIDAVMVEENRFSSKPPNYPLLMFLEAKPLAWLTGWNFFDKQVFFVHYLVLLNQVLPYLLMLWMALVFARQFTRDNFTLSWLMLCLSLGILPFGYAVTITNHTPAAVLYFLAFFLSYQILHGEAQKSWKHYAVLGLILGYAGSIELPGLVFGGIFGVQLLLKNPRLALLTAACGLLPFVIQSVILYQISGSIKPFYLQSGVYYYEGSYWLHPESHDLTHEPKLIYAFHVLLGHHGLFSMSPVLVLGLLGGIFWKNRYNLPHARFFGLLLGGMALLVIYFVFRTYNYGGWCIGMRWFIHFMPILMFMGLPVIEKLGKSHWGKGLLGLLLLISLVPNLQALQKEAFVRSWLELWWINLFG